MPNLTPVTIATERSLISLILNDSSTFDKVSLGVSASDFTDGILAFIFTVCKKFHSNEKSWTWEAIADAVKQVEKRPVGLDLPVVYLAELVSLKVVESSLETLVGQIHERSLRIKLDKRLDIMKTDLNNPAKTVIDLHSGLMSIEEDLFDRSSIMKVIDVDSTNIFWQLKKEVARISSTPFVGTGYPSLDCNLTWGFAPGQLSLIAGRPSMGKSTLRSNIMYNLTNSGVYTITISKEQSIASEIFRLVAIETGMSVTDLPRVNQWGDKENSFDEEKFTECMKKFSSGWNHRLIKPLGVFYVRDIKRVILDSRKKGFDPRVVFVDLFDQLDDFANVKQSELANVIYRKLNICADMATELDVHICLVCQFKRLGKDRDNVDMREQFKDSGGYEQRADLALGVLRPAYYKPDELEDNRILVQIVKQRDGAVKTTELHFNCESLKVEDLNTVKLREQIELTSNEYSERLKA